MSLEQAIVENTAAINKLIAIMSKAPCEYTGPQTSEEEMQMSSTGKEAVQAAAPLTAPEAIAKAVKEAESKPAEPVKQYTYAEVARRVTDVINKRGRDAAKQIFIRFGVSRLPEVDPKDWPEVMDACDSVEHQK